MQIAHEGQRDGGAGMERCLEKTVIVEEVIGQENLCLQHVKCVLLLFLSG